MKEIIPILKDANLNNLVYNALSFGTAVMFGAFVYFLTQIKSVSKEYQTGVAVSAVVVAPPKSLPNSYKTWQTLGRRSTYDWGL